jgi:hypothetical protein
MVRTDLGGGREVEKREGGAPEEKERWSILGDGEVEHWRRERGST